MKKNTWTLLLLVCTVLSFTSCTRKSDTDSKELAKDQNEAKFDDTKREDDTKFAVEAADGGLLEVQLAQLALANASSKQVKDFAQSMVKEHSKVNEELKSLATKKNITLPGTLSDESKREYDKLAEKRGKDFDEAYCDFIVKEHKDDIDKFKKEADDGNDADLKSWASEKLPALQHHLSMAESVEDAVDNNKNASDRDNDKDK
jgi:putative membrane protein